MGYPPGAPPGGGYPPQMQQQRPAGPPRAANPAQGVAIGLLIAAGLMVIAIFSYSWVTVGAGDEGSIGVGPMGIKACRHDECRSSSWGDAGGDDVPGDITAMSYLSLIATLGGAALAGVVGAMLLGRNPGKAPWKLARGVIGAASGFSAFFVVRIFSLDEIHGAGPGWSLFVGFAGYIAGGILAQKAAAHVVAMPSGPPGGHPYGGPPGGNPYGGPPGGPPGGNPYAPGGGNPYGAAPGGPGGNPYGGAPHAGPPGGNPYAQQPPGGNPYAQQPPQQQPPQQQPAAQAMGTAPTMASGAGGPAPAAQTHPCPRCTRPLVFVAQYQRWFCESCKQYA